MTVAAPSGHHAQLRIVDLSRSGLVPKLHDGFDQVVHAGIVRLRQQAAVGVDGQFSAESIRPPSTNGPPSPFLQKPADSICKIAWPVKQS